MSLSAIGGNPAVWVSALSALLMLGGCGQPEGIAVVRVSELAGPCEIVWDSDRFPIVPRDLEYEQVRTAAAFQGGSRWSGGHLVAMGWVEEDGSIARLQLDLGPTHGYRATYMPTNEHRESLQPEMQQAISYVVWRDGVRVAAARDVNAVIQYVPKDPDPAAGPFASHGRPGTLFLHAAFDVVDAAGDTQCHIVAVHARADAARDELYDPSWLEPRPSAAIVEEDAVWTSPTFEGDVEPTRELIRAEDAPSDPGGDAPDMETRGDTLFEISRGGGNSCG